MVLEHYVRSSYISTRGARTWTHNRFDVTERNERSTLTVGLRRLRNFEAPSAKSLSQHGARCGTDTRITGLLSAAYAAVITDFATIVQINIWVCENDWCRPSNNNQQRYTTTRGLHYTTVSRHIQHSRVEPPPLSNPTSEEYYILNRVFTHFPPPHPSTHPRWDRPRA
jgi:hypothetical protein